MPAGFGGVGMGAGGGVAGTTSRGDSTAGQITGSERFIRGARQPGQFVGSDSSDARNFMSQMSTLAAFSQQNRGNNSDAQNANRQSGNSRNSRRTQPRVETTVGFDFTPSQPVYTGTLLQSRFTSPRLNKLGDITVRMEGRTAILSGVVPTEHDRALAEQLALLEAGVDSVRNELTSSAAPPKLPPPEAQPPAASPSAVPPAATSPG